MDSREPLCLSSRISRTLVSCSSLSEPYLLGESVSCQMQGESVGWWSNFILSPHKTRGGVSEGLGTSRRCRVNQGPTRQVGRLQVQGRDTPRRCHLGSTHYVITAYQGTMPSLRLSVGKFLPSPIQSVPIPSPSRLGFFFLFDYRLRHCAHFDTSPPGAFGRDGFHGESV
jgi:hypothetical protein